MAGQQRNMEGNNEQRQRAAREARRDGKSASEVGKSLGASKQRKAVRANASHQERMEGKSKGKTGPGTSGKPRPGNRDVDPKRTNRYV